MGSNLTVLRNLLLTCPDCSLEDIFAICKISNNKQFASHLIELYKNEIDVDEKSFGYEVPNIILNEDEYFDELIEYINHLNNYIEEENIFFANYDLVGNICGYLENIISTNYKSRVSEATEEIPQKSLSKVIESIKNDNDINNIVDALVFDVRDIAFFKKVFEKYSSAFRKHFKKPSNIDVLIQKYIDLAKDEKTEEYVLISSSKIISYIINNNNISLSSKDKKRHLKVLYNTSSKISLNKYSSYERKRIIKSLNILINNIKDEKPSTKQRFETNINEKYGIKPTFSDKALEELKNLKKVNNKLYVDLTDKYIISIDKSKRSCSEDALSIEVLPNGNYLLGIYITDVYSYINENSVLELEAYNRTKTIYMPKKTLTMFPEDLVDNKLSLSSNKNQYVIASLFELSPSFDLINHEIKRAIITLNANKSFDEIEYDVKHGRDIKASETYQILMKLSDYIRKTNPTFKKHNNNFCNSKNGINTSAESVIESFMVYLNYNVKNIYEPLDLPCIYKIYLMNNGQLINNNTYNKTLKDFVIDNLSQPPKSSFYSINKNQYKGSNICVNMPLTTPVRNYASLQNQKLVQKYYIDKQIIKDKEIYNLEEQLKIISNHMNEKNKIIKEYVEEYSYEIKKYRRK